MKRVLGLDIGISSVGWGIIDLDTNQVIDAGVRLFTEAAKENNEKRRSFRSARRLKRRRANRKKDLIKILEKYNLLAQVPSTMNPYALRCKGLNELLSKEELNTVLFHICKHRGSSLEVIEEESNEKEEGLAKGILAENDRQLKAGKYICEVQFDRLKEKGKLRGSENNFRSSDYEKELRRLLRVQNIENEAAEEIIKCILRRRHFDEGPGSFESPSIYGRLYNEDGTVKVGMIEKMRGKCSVFEDQPRAPKLSPSAEFYNLLNDLNNLKVDDEPLDLAVKQEIFKAAFEKGSLTPNQISKMVGVSLEDIRGFRLDKDSKPLISKLEGFKTFKKLFNAYGKDEFVKNVDLMDKIAEILTNTKVKEERVCQIRGLNIGSNELVYALAECKGFAAYHAFSLKALRMLNEELYNTVLNQMQILHTSGYFGAQRISQKGKKNISINDEAVLSPVAMRAYRQAIKVVNAVRTRYGELDSIVVETTRDKNSSEQKKRINETQKHYQKLNDEVESIMVDYPGIKITGKLRTKIRLYLEQDGKSAYTQRPIDLNLLITDPTAYEIDHIIPISISLDDSINNKALCTRLENQQKGQLSPLMAFEKGKFTSGSIDGFKFFVKSLLSKKPGISFKKYCNYIYAKDISRYENMQEFVARNLVDTSYANRLVFNTLTSYFKDNGIETKVHTIKGQATSAFRKRVKGLEKDRDKDYSHHAVDALIVASIKKLNLYNKLLKDFSVSERNVVYNAQTGEVIEAREDLLLDKPYMQFLNQLANLSHVYDEQVLPEYRVIKLSHQIDTKPNRSIADQTIYSTRNYGKGDVVVKKYKNIYDPKFTTLAEDILNNKTDKYLMAKHDPQTFEKISEVIKHYYKEFTGDRSKVKIEKGEIKLSFNPLSEHLKETGEMMTKYAKKNNGPVITSMKWTDGKLGSHVDITKNYTTKNKKVVLQQISPYRTDFYLDNGVYKFVTVRYSNVSYSEAAKEYYIDEFWYNSQKELKKISSDASFCFSIHHNEIIEITDKKGKGLWKFTATKNDSGNGIEVKPLTHYSKDRFVFTIGKSTTKLTKYSCDPLGKMTEIKGSVLKLRFKSSTM